MFTYPVLTDEEIARENLPIEPGNYDFEVTSATEKTSKSSGNQMIELILKVWKHDGSTTNVYDWLVATRKMAWKTKHFWESVGRPEMYEQGNHTESDYLNMSGKVEIGLQLNDKKIMSPKVMDYLIADEVHAKKPFIKGDDFPDEDVPF